MTKHREGFQPVSPMKRAHRSAVNLLPLFFWALVSCHSNQDYMNIPVPERRMNLSGLEAVATRYLNEHPGDFYKFHRILTAADDAIGKHEWITRSGVIR